MNISSEGELLNERLLPVKVGGSWSSAITVCNVWRRRADRGNPVPPQGLKLGLVGTSVYISGNPAKYLQGHNVYGSDDLPQLAALFFQAVAKFLGFDKNTQDLWYQIGFTGQYEPTRLDITNNYRVEGGSEGVNQWIRAAHSSARVSHKNAGVLRGNTLYFGKESRRHTIKMYNKYQDLIVHRPCSMIRDIDVTLSDALLEKHSFKNLGKRENGWVFAPCSWNHISTRSFNSIVNRMFKDADGLLRVEQTFRGKKLRDLGFDLARGLDEMKVRQLYNDGMKSFTLSSQTVSNDINPQSVGKPAYKMYLSWMGGYLDLNAFSRPTVWKHRKTLLEFGVDITIPRDEKNTPVVIPLIRVLEAVPASAPDFYRQYGLLAAA